MNGWFGFLNARYHVFLMKNITIEFLFSDALKYVIPLVRKMFDIIDEQNGLSKLFPNGRIELALVIEDDFDGNCSVLEKARSLMGDDVVDVMERMEEGEVIVSANEKLDKIFVIGKIDAESDVTRDKELCCYIMTMLIGCIGRYLDLPPRLRSSDGREENAIEISNPERYIIEVANSMDVLFKCKQLSFEN